MIVGINASRAKSGGAIAHITGIISQINFNNYNIKAIHIWSFPDILDLLPNSPFLFKHSPLALRGSIVKQLFWERFLLPKQLVLFRCDVLFNVDAGSICRFNPCITLSQDMLSYEKGEIKRFGWTKERLRLILLKWIQNASLKNADGAIFLTHYAANIIQKSSGKCKKVAHIPHGIGESFKMILPKRPFPRKSEQSIECLYVSNTAPYKHQWNVVKAIQILRNKGFKLNLHLVGGGAGTSQKKLEKQIFKSDPNREFVFQRPFVAHEKLPEILSSADLFVFASSCENMPITLLEGMAVGLPIASSDRGPMPEILKDGGVYFNPENPDSISKAIERLILDEDLRLKVSAKAKILSNEFSWKRCAHETFSFIKQTFEGK